MIGELTPAQASSLSLLLRHGQSYGDVGRRLGIDPMSVRVRAHEAVALLVGEEPQTGADRLLLDRALGQVTTVGAGADLARLDDSDGAPRLEFLMEALEPFRASRVSPPAAASVAVAPPSASEPVEPPLAAVAPPSAPEPVVALSARQTTLGTGPAVVRTPRTRTTDRRSRRHVVSARMGAMFSLGLGFLAAGGVLFINGAH